MPPLMTPVSFFPGRYFPSWTAVPGVRRRILRTDRDDVGVGIGTVLLLTVHPRSAATVVA